MAIPKFRDTDELFDYLMKFVNVEKGQATVFKLDRMRELAERLGNPERGRMTVHVAGSKGKGSVSNMCANILSKAGIWTGLYTSPHILRWRERIAVAGAEIPEERLLSSAYAVLPVAESFDAAGSPSGEAPTFFEVTTLIAFRLFRDVGCGAQIIETGLGGRLDSTNIVLPDVSVITRIELEHTQFLGDTLRKIAGEKAGIIKPEKPVCIAPQDPEALEAMLAKAEETRSPVYLVQNELDIGSVEVSPEGTSCVLKPKGSSRSRLRELLGRKGMRLRCPMPGEVQAWNMGTAALASALASPDVSPENLRDGLACSCLPARFEILQGEPPIVLDGAHTPDSIRLTLRTMKRIFPGKLHLLFACAYDKKHEQMAEILKGNFASTIVTKPGSFKASDPDSVFKSFKDHQRPTLIPDTREAILAAIERAKAEEACLLIAGSFYLCAEAATLLGQAG